MDDLLEAVGELVTDHVNALGVETAEAARVLAWWKLARNLDVTDAAAELVTD